MSSFNRGYGTLSAHQRPTVGDTKMSVASLDHMGWLLCDGRPLNVKEFYLLFSMIQYSFGGSGSTFLLPKAAGRVPGVVGQATITPDLSGADHPLGDVVGEEVHQLTMPEMAEHDHYSGPQNADGANENSVYTEYSLTNQTLTDPGHGHTGTTDRQVDRIESEGVSNIGSGAQVSGLDPQYLNVTIQNRATGVTLNDPTHRHQVILPGAGENVPHNTMQPTIFMGNMFIYSGKPGKGTYPYTTNTPYSSKTLIL